jgi:hypothetical protein
VINFHALETEGFVRLRNLIDRSNLMQFEATISRMAEAGLKLKKCSANGEEPMSALLKAGGEYRARLFANLKNLKIVQEMSASVSRYLEKESFLEWASLGVPVVYPSLRADPPDETKYLLPFHQDYATQCARAWRVWVPLRDANTENGTMKVVPRSHLHGFVNHDASDPSRPVVPESLLAGEAPITVDIPAGDGILFNPLLFHASVPTQRNRMKYVLLVQVQDLATLGNFDDPEDPIAQRLDMVKHREQARN